MSVAPTQADGGTSAPLSKARLLALCASGAIPAVGIASFPLLLVGPAGYGSWVAALLTAAIGFALARIVIVFARRYVSSGSLASFAGEVFGQWARTVVAAALMLGYLGQLIGIQVLFAIYLSSFLAGIGVDAATSPTSMVVMFLVSGAVPAVIARRGLDASARIAILLTAVSVPVLLFISGASAWHTGLELDRQLSLEGASISGIVIGLGAAAAWLVSFESGATLAEETAEPKNTVPLAVLVVPILVFGYFVMTVLQIPGLLRVGDQLATGISAPAALAVEAGLGEGVARATDLLLAAAVFAALLGYTNYLSRILAASAEDGLLPQLFARRNHDFGTPGRAIGFAAGASTSILIGTVVVSADSLLTMYSALATMTVYLWVLPYVLICAAAVVLLVRENALGIGVVCCAAIGALGMVWPWVNSFINPPAPPIDSMTYAAVAAVVALGLTLRIIRRRSDVAGSTHDACAHGLDRKSADG
ncbi:APC family permease [Nocardia sp. NPDC058379]|uniref:APC family permease n=1 Tax=unclassified Nocardia TaxID=2637762 RepID=UPI0036587B0C